MSTESKYVAIVADTNVWMNALDILVAINKFNPHIKIFVPPRVTRELDNLNHKHRLPQNQMKILLAKANNKKPPHLKPAEEEALRTYRANAAISFIFSKWRSYVDRARQNGSQVVGQEILNDEEFIKNCSVSTIEGPDDDKYGQHDGDSAILDYCIWLQTTNKIPLLFLSSDRLMIVRAENQRVTTFHYLASSRPLGNPSKLKAWIRSCSIRIAAMAGEVRNTSSPNSPNLSSNSPNSFTSTSTRPKSLTNSSTKPVKRNRGRPRKHRSIKTGLLKIPKRSFHPSASPIPPRYSPSPSERMTITDGNRDVGCFTGNYVNHTHSSSPHPYMNMNMNMNMYNDMSYQQASSPHPAADQPERLIIDLTGPSGVRELVDLV